MEVVVGYVGKSAKRGTKRGVFRSAVIISFCLFYEKGAARLAVPFLYLFKLFGEENK